MRKMTKQRLCKPPFSEYKATGPYFNRNSGRHMVTLLPLEPDSELKPRNYPYARYIMAVHLGRDLDTAEHIDHKDGDRTHDKVENLCILTKSENSIKGANDPLRLLRRSEKLFDFKCPHCEEWFRRPKGKSHLGKKGKSVTYCSRACSRYANRYQGIKQEIKWVEPEKFTPKMVTESWDDWSLTLPTQYAFVMKPSRAKIKVCDLCRKPFTGKRKVRAHRYCSPACSKKAKAREVPTKERMERFLIDIAEGKTSWSEVGRSFGKSDNAVRKWAKKYGLL